MRKATFIVSPTIRADWETLLEERLADDGFIVTSREILRDGPWRIDVFGEGDPAQVEAAIAEGGKSLGEADWGWEELPDIDWVVENQRSFQPFSVGPFWVHPSHNLGTPPADAIPLRIDAGLAFGTGTHATTRGCLEMLATVDSCNAVDVGCGSGILAIAMAKLWQRKVIGGDNDGEAVGVAIENAELNGTANLCRFVESFGPRSRPSGPMT
jgi:ribosomal protein L11 methyltransferase